MKGLAPHGPRQQGFSFVEVLVAVAVLALCAVPLADAIKGGLAASTAGKAKAQELRCMKNTMETVLAESYRDLAGAALGQGTATRYSQAADAVCLARNVYIARYELEAGKSPVFLDAGASAARLESAMLYITVSSPDGTYAFTTLVAP